MFNSLVPRVRNTFPGGGVKERIFFMHVPKCGGTSTDSAFRKCYLTLDIRQDSRLVRFDSRAYAKAASVLHGHDLGQGYQGELDVLEFSEKFLAYNMSRPNVRYISGHISFNQRIFDEYNEQYKYITVLRDPIKMVVSSYFYAKYRANDHWQIEEDFPEFLSTERGRSLGCRYVKYLSGLKQDTDFTSQDSIEQAKANLSQFDLVGILEDLGTFAIAFQNRFRVRLDIPTRNVSPVSDSFRKEKITDEVYEVIKKVCAPDIEVYNHARSMTSKA